jgi:hypothetical protein
LSWRYYQSVPPLGLRGARLLRLPNDQADDYRVLTRYLETESDAFITIPGLNSLYFWTGQTPPTYFNVSEVVLLNDRQQAQVMAALQKAVRPRIVVNESAVSNVTLLGPLGRLLREHCRELKRFGRFRVLEPEQTAR